MTSVTSGYGSVHRPPSTVHSQSSPTVDRGPWTVDRRRAVSTACRLGFTLVEVLVSITILAASVTVIMQALAHGAAALHGAETRLKAYLVTNQVMADLELQLQQSLPVGLKGRSGQGRDEFRWQVSQEPLANDEQMELVTMALSWEDAGRQYGTVVNLLHRLPAPAEPAVAQ